MDSLNNSLVKNRLLKGAGANFLGLLTSIIIQVVSVPVFLKYWGVELYGEWLIISSLAINFTMGDVGLVTIASNEMAMLVANDKRKEALSIFQSAWILVTIISLVIIGLVFVIANFLPLGKWLNISHQNHGDILSIFMLLSVNTILGFQFGLIGAGLRCEGHYPLNTVFNVILRFLAFLALLIGVCFGANLLQAAIIFLGVNIIGLISGFIILKKRNPWICYGLNHFNIKHSKHLFLLSIAFMSFPIGYILNIQGFVVLIGIVLGPVAVVIFSTLRTFSRLSYQVISAISATIWPEISLAFGSGKIELAKRIHRSACKVSLWVSCLMVVLLYFSGRWIVYIWTRGRIAFDQDVFNMLLLILIVNSLWNASIVIPLAINKHKRIAFIYIISSVFSLFLAFHLMRAFGLLGAASALLAVDIIMAIFVLKNALVLLKDNIVEFLEYIIKPVSIKEISSLVAKGK